ncbi:MAG: oligosaccharide flippase family protein [Sulfuritalea sp.]|nr:oligosaccharide flippase family protein [Sulfuritalea sp.]
MAGALRNAAGSGYVLYLLPSLVQGGVGLLLVPVTTHFLDPADFGVFALLIAVAMPVRAFAATGARWVIGGNYFNATEIERRTMLFNVLAFELALRGLLILLLFVAAEPVLHWLVSDYRPEYVRYLNLVLAASLASSLWPAISFLMTVKNSPRLFAIFSLVQTFAGALTTVICLVVLGWGVESLFLAMVVAACVSVVLELLYVRRLVNFSLERKWLKEVVNTGLRATPGGLAEVASNMVDKIAIQRWAGLGTLGLYSHSQQYQSIFKMLTAALSNTLTTDSLKIYSRELDPAPLERMLSAWYGMLAVVGIGVALFSDDLIALLTHGKFVGSAPLVLIWYLMVFSVSNGIPYANFLMARKRNRVLMYTQLIPTLAGIGLVGVGAYVYGVFGAAWAILLTSVAIQVSRRLMAHRLGYKGIAERRFAEALLVYGTLWFLDDLLVWGMGTEIGVSLLLIPAVVVRFDLMQEMRRVLLRQEPGRAAE